MMNDPYRHMDGYDPPPADRPAPYEYMEDPVSVQHRQNPERYDFDVPDHGDPEDWPVADLDEFRPVAYYGQCDAGHDDEPPRYEEQEADSE